MKHAFLLFIAVAGVTGLGSPLRAGTIQFTLLGDPNRNYTAAGITEAVGPYAGYLGEPTPKDLYGFLCLDFLKTSNWNTSYSGFVYGIADVVSGKTPEQLVEAGYLVDKLMMLGGAAAGVNIYQGPISFAVWQIMDPAAGHVPVDPAAQPYVLEARQAYLSGAVTAASLSGIRIFVPDNGSLQSFMTEVSGVPEPGTLGLLLLGGGTDCGGSNQAGLKTKMRSAYHYGATRCALSRTL